MLLQEGWTALSEAWWARQCSEDLNFKPLGYNCMQNNSTSCYQLKIFQVWCNNQEHFTPNCLRLAHQTCLLFHQVRRYFLYGGLLYRLFITYQLLQFRFCCTVTSMKIKSCIYSTCINVIFSHLSLCADQVLKTALSLYMEDKTLPLPTFEEILICTPSTTSEEVRPIALDSEFHLWNTYIGGLAVASSCWRSQFVQNILLSTCWKLTLPDKWSSPQMPPWSNPRQKG